MSYDWKEIYSPSFKLPNASSSKQKIPSPPGYKDMTTTRKSLHTQSSSKPRDITLEKLIAKKNWEFSMSPLKSLPMNAIMSYFAPNSLQLIPILMTLNLFLTPLKEIVSNLGKFDNMEFVETPDILLMKLIYIVCWCCNMGIGVWKLNQMGLIPNTKSDWLSWEVAQKVIERS